MLSRIKSDVRQIQLQLKPTDFYSLSSLLPKTMKITSKVRTQLLESQFTKT